MSEFTAFTAETVDITIGATFPYVLREEYTKDVVEAAATRLKAFAKKNRRLQDAYSLAVATHTFDVYGDWAVELSAHYDTDIQSKIPSVTELLETYFDVERFFAGDVTLNAVCWYTAFQTGNRGGGGE